MRKSTAPLAVDGISRKMRRCPSFVEVIPKHRMQERLVPTVTVPDLMTTRAIELRNALINGTDKELIDRLYIDFWIDVEKLARNNLRELRPEDRDEVIGEIKWMLLKKDIRRFRGEAPFEHFLLT